MDPESADTPKRSGTLKKKSSVKRVGSKRSRVGSIRSLKLEETELSNNYVLYSPVPTQGNPTEILVNRFQSKSKYFVLLVERQTDSNRQHGGRF